MNIKSMKWVLAASAVAALVACGGGSDPVKVVVSANTTANATAATTAAVVGQTFSFPAGVAVLGTTGPTTLAVSGTAAAQTAAVASGGQTASGPLTFGSCIMTITASTFPDTSPLALGKTLTVNPCSIGVQTAGLVVTGDSTTSNANVTINFGGVSSSPIVIPVTVSSSGNVVIGTTAVGTSTVTITTGT